jgi:hypothetical protein
MLLEAGRAHASLMEWVRCQSKGENGCAREERMRRNGAYEAYAKSNQRCFVYGELSDLHYYDGCHYRRLLARFPDSPEAVEAAFKLAMMPELYDCEDGRTAAGCVIKGHLAPAVPHFEKVGTSPHAAELVAYLNRIFLDAARAASSDRAKGLSIDLKAVFDLVDQYARAAEALRPPDACVAWDALAESALMLGDGARAARLSERVVAAGVGGEAGERARVRLAKMMGATSGSANPAR